MSLLIHILPERHLFNKYLLSSKIGTRDFPRLWQYICKHTGETDITFIIRNFRRGGFWCGAFREACIQSQEPNYCREPRKVLS